MEKLFRFLTLALIYIIICILAYTVLPSIVWLFGGSFTAVAQHPAYAIFVGLSIGIMVAAVMNECFDKDFLSKD